MAENQLRYKITADSSGFVNGVKQAATSTNNLNKGLNKSQRGLRRNSQAFTQLAYAMDDAQYGFRGVQNNLQQIAVQAGIGGPAILGITALLIVIQQVIEKTDIFTSSVDNQKTALENNRKQFEELTSSVDDFVDSLNLSNVALSKQYAELVAQGEAIDDIVLAGNAMIKNSNILSKETEIHNLKKKNAQYGETKERLIDIAKLEKELANEVVNHLEEQHKQAISQEDKDKTFLALQAARRVARRKEIALIKAQNKEEKKTSQPEGSSSGIGYLGLGKADKAIAVFRDNIEKLKQAYSKGEIDFKDFTSRMSVLSEELHNKLNPPTTPEKEDERWKGLLPDFDVLTAEFQQNIGILKAAYEQGKIDFEKFVEAMEELSERLDKALGNTTKKIKTEAEKISDTLKASLATSLTSFITNFATTIGEALANGFNGDDALKVIGGFMQQFGSALIAIGVTKMIADAGLMTFGGGGAIVAAGIGLVAAGAAVSAAANTSYVKGGAGRSTGGSISATNYSTTPFMSQQNQGGSGQLVATVRGPDLIFALQNANATYGQTGG